MHEQRIDFDGILVSFFVFMQLVTLFDLYVICHTIKTASDIAFTFVPDLFVCGEYICKTAKTHGGHKATADKSHLPKTNPNIFVSKTNNQGTRGSHFSHPYKFTVSIHLERIGVCVCVFLSWP